MTDSDRHVEFAVVGSGFSGLAMAIALERDGRSDFVVLERADELGGTWRDNTYPGCACDIPSVLYSWSDAQNPQWSHAFAEQPEIWHYMRGVVARHDLGSRILFGHELQSARWDGELQRWRLETSRGTLTAEVLISGAGGLADPVIPQLPGLERFGGTIFHSARWDHDHALEGRHVAVVGTGASAIQFVPQIQPEVAQLHVFQRTPPWVLPRSNPRVPERRRERFQRHPRLMRAYRNAVFSLMESLHFGFQHPAVMRVAERRARGHIARQVPDPQLRERLTPDYRLGCKRVLGSDAWYPALCADNVEVVTSGISEVVADGVVDSDGVQHPVDTIIFGTGFRATDQPISHRIVGRDGQTLAESWQGSPKAHLGLAVTGFPNLFLLLGPNTGLGHNSVLLMVEAQVAYIRQALAQRHAHAIGALEPAPEAQARWVAEVDEGTEGSVWTAGGCLSWYTDVTGRNSTLWPGSVRAYQRRIRRFAPGDYLTRPRRSAAAPARVLA
jgi:cation diffusion facilitator CzcD-associated flavoprotein CzcO